MNSLYLTEDSNKPDWIISNELITKLGIEPAGVTHYGMCLCGEDGNYYDIDEVMRKFLVVAEGVLNEILIKSVI